MNELRTKFLAAASSLAVKSRFQTASDAELKLWAGYVDESDYGLQDWTETLAALLTWLPKGAAPSTQDLFEYVGCCAEGLRLSGPHSSLRDAAEEYFQTYGFEKYRPN